MRRSFKSVAGLIIILGMCLIGIIYRDNVFKFYSKYYDNNRKNITISNFEYSTTNKYSSASLTMDFIAKNKEQLTNIYYTIINSGNNRFTFYCDVDYKECLDDIEKISASEEELAFINNFVHPYNSFSSIRTLYASNGKVELEIIKSYTSEQIIYLNQVLKEFIDKNISSNMTDREKIKIIHDYIISNTKYDFTSNLSSEINHYNSNIAYGVFKNKKGICSGYTDAMALFLYELGIENYKISNDDHIWNYVILDGIGYHLDLTWDDPILETGEEKIEYFYFLIDDNILKILSKEDHYYDKTLYGI